jgi:hypothetical protein
MARVNGGAAGSWLLAGNYCCVDDNTMYKPRAIAMVVAPSVID